VLTAPSPAMLATAAGGTYVACYRGETLGPLRLMSDRCPSAGQSVLNFYCILEADVWRSCAMCQERSKTRLRGCASISHCRGSRRRAGRPANLNFLSHLYCHQILAQFQRAPVSLSRRRD
jgi:hypothetical protein